MSKFGETIETTHREYRVIYTESSDLWSCRDLGFESESLKRVKALIDKHIRGQNAVSISAVRLSEHGGHEIGKLTGIAGESSAFFVCKSRPGALPTRQKVGLSSMALDNGETRAAMRRMKELRLKAHALHAECKAVLEAIPRLSAADLRELNEKLKQEVDTDDQG